MRGAFALVSGVLGWMVVGSAVAVATLQQSSGEHRAAMSHSRRAIHLRRISEGLDTPS